MELHVKMVLFQVALTISRSILQFNKLKVSFKGVLLVLNTVFNIMTLARNIA